MQGICFVWTTERNRRRVDMRYSGCCGSWIQAINLVVLLPESSEITQRENNYYHSIGAVTLAALYFLVFRHSLTLSDCYDHNF